MDSYKIICLYIFAVTILYNKLANGLEDDIHELNRQKRLTPDNITTGVSKRTPPDFRGPGRRISDIKCYEYIWAMTEDAKDRKKLYDSGLFDSLKTSEERQQLGKEVDKKILRPPTQYPHMGALGWRTSKYGSKDSSGVFKCGCTLISPKFALTAAHCTRLSRNETGLDSRLPVLARFGDNNINDTNFNESPAVIAYIKRIIPHPKYKAPSLNYDIAVLELYKELKIDRYVRPACLFKNEITTSLGPSGHVAEWKFIKPGHTTSWHQLQTIPVDLTESQLCGESQEPWCNRHWCGSQDHQFCAGKMKGVDSCQGEEGGPLQVQIPLPSTNTEGNLYYVVGVTSLGTDCSKPDTPGIYTRVSSVIDWIESVVWRQS